MKKKFFAIYALMGAMAVSPIFTSCVDSEETPSVEALRNAKAEELKAIADLNNAQAASKTALASAEAALINAKAEAQKAQNKLTEARLAWFETQNESERAALEVTIKQAEADLARIQGEIDAQAITLQAQLMWVKKQLLQAQKDLDTATKNYDAYEKAKLQTLANNYATAVQELSDLQLELISMKALLVNLETGKIKAETALEKTIEANNKQIALNNIQIEAYKKYAAYTEDMNALYLSYQSLRNEMWAAQENKNAAESAYIDAYNKVNFGGIYSSEPTWQAIENDKFFRFVCYDGFNTEDNEYVNTYFVSRHFNNTNFSTELQKYEYEDADGNVTSEFFGETFKFEYELTTDIREIEVQVKDQLAWYNGEIKTLNERITANTTAHTAAVAATAAAKTAWDAAVGKDDEGEKKQAYEEALNEEVRLANQIKSDKASVENYNKSIARLNTAWDIAKNADKYYAELEAKIEAHNDACAAAWEETVAAWMNMLALNDAYDVAYAEYDAIYTAYYNANDIATNIKNLEEKVDANDGIKSNKELLAEIEQAQKLLTQYDGYDMPFEVAIEFQNAKIAAQEAVIAAYEVKVKDAKEALDAAMPAEEEETPAE